jgi:hypothetical protein
MKMGLLGGDDEPKVLTRDNEPDDYFATWVWHYLPAWIFIVMFCSSDDLIYGFVLLQ